MQPQAVLDQTKVDRFVGKVLGDTSATLVTLLAALGDRLGLFKELAASGPVTSADLASRDRAQRAVSPSVARRNVDGWVHLRLGYTAFQLAARAYARPRARGWSLLSSAAYRRYFLPLARESSTKSSESFRQRWRRAAVGL